MAAIKVTVLLLVLLVCSCRASRTGTSSTGFFINSLLTCNVPFYTRNGGFMAVPERTLTVPILQDSSTPAPSGYQRPIGEPSQALLRMFLGFDYNDNLTSIEARTGPAGSPRLSIPIPIRGAELPPESIAAIRSFLNSENAGNCPFTRVWRQLDDTFFPRFYAAGTCTNSSCSVPAGLQCEADPSAMITAFALRWDCCLNFIARSSNFAVACGWRKVLIPFLDGCRCACSPR